MTLGDKLGELRKKKGLTQEELSIQLNISRQTLYNWEKGSTSPDIMQAKNIASFFGISLDDLTNNEVDIRCKDKSNDLLDNLIGHECFISFADDFFDGTIAYNTKFKVLEVSSNFIKVQYEISKRRIIKLIDIDMIVSIMETLEVAK